MESGSNIDIMILLLAPPILVEMQASLAELRRQICCDMHSGEVRSRDVALAAALTARPAAALAATLTSSDVELAAVSRSPAAAITVPGEIDS